MPSMGLSLILLVTTFIAHSSAAQSTFIVEADGQVIVGTSGVLKIGNVGEAVPAAEEVVTSPPPPPGVPPVPPSAPPTQPPCVETKLAWTGASASSTWGGDSWAPEKAIDGSTSTNSLTNGDANAWWLGTLSDISTVTKVGVYNTAGSQSRLWADGWRPGASNSRIPLEVNS